MRRRIEAWNGRAKCYAFPMHLSRVDKKAVLTAIGTEIRRLRLKLGISQVALATRARVHYNVVGRTERGIHNPTIMTLDAIATALNISLVKLLRGVPAAR
jgi:ribosome-binding protein aMBF1 (putative translation factor)